METLNMYGDNILECQEAACLLADAVGGVLEYEQSPLYTPIYLIRKGLATLYQIQLFPGYGRWAYDVQLEMRRRGTCLREAPDAIVSRIITGVEEPFLAFEFSGALPAGNQAWQRCGRALGCAEAKIPFLYYAELAGIELDADRSSKAPRFPNPVIPFAYYALGLAYESLSLPVYQPSPSASSADRKHFAAHDGSADALEVVAAILLGQSPAQPAGRLRAKAIGFTKILTEKRVRQNTFEPQDWQTLGALESGRDKANWMLRRKMPWRKKISISVTDSLKELLRVIEQMGAVAIGSSDMPVCLLPSDARPALCRALHQIYGRQVGADFLKWLQVGTKPIVIVWLAGFKPAGDDSRPDRGLVPLVRMIFGREPVDILSVVYGPGKSSMWRQLEKDMWALAETNGLWEAVVNLSNAILADSQTASDLQSNGLIVRPRRQPYSPPQGKLFSPTTPLKPQQFGEQDVDSVVHLLFSLPDRTHVLEDLCNPPGGDWSGISFFQGERELRWTSLRRVSGEGAKRPDHIFQFKRHHDKDILMVVESKDLSSKIEDRIGVRLKEYVDVLFRTAPNASRSTSGGAWQPMQEAYRYPDVEILSCAAFRYLSDQDLQYATSKSAADLVIGVEFSADDLVRVHFGSQGELKWMAPAIAAARKTFGRYLEIQVH